MEQITAFYWLRTKERAGEVVELWLEGSLPTWFFLEIMESVIQRKKLVQTQN